MTLRPRDRIAIGVVVIVALVGVFYLLVLKPEQQKASALDAAIATQRHTLAQEQQSYQAGREAQSQLRSRQAQWAALSVAVPEQSDIPALLRILERNANAVHVGMQSIQLSGASASSASSTSSSSAGSSTASASGATGVPVQLTFAGGYRALDALVHRLDGLVVLSGDAVHAHGPLMSISNVTLGGAPHLTVQLSATIYQLSAASSAAGAATGGHP
jgi:hypothetical protein